MMGEDINLDLKEMCDESERWNELAQDLFYCLNFVLAVLKFGFLLPQLAEPVLYFPPFIYHLYYVK
jgi:hypothetical protein